MKLFVPALLFLSVFLNIYLAGDKLNQYEIDRVSVVQSSKSVIPREISLLSSNDSLATRELLSPTGCQANDNFVIDDTEEAWQSEINTLLLEKIGLDEIGVDKYNELRDEYFENMAELLGDAGFKKYIAIRDSYYQKFIKCQGGGDKHE